MTEESNIDHLQSSGDNISSGGGFDIDQLQENVNKAKASFSGTLALSVGMTVAAHPLSYVKVLVQVGHEPLAPTQTTTLFGKKVWRLPNFFQYAGHIKKVDGFFGLYRGLSPRIAQNIINSVVTTNVSSLMKQDEEEKGNKVGDPKSVQEFLRETGNMAVSKTAGAVLSYPFHVISIRMMVQFIGRETKYSSIVSSITEIYREEGISGFFSGIVPHLIGELFALWLFRTLNYMALNYLVSEEYSQTSEVRSYCQGISNYLASVVTYPFQLVTNIMAVNDSKIAAGCPPLMPIYASWSDCWVELGKKGLRNRGSTLFRRNVIA